MEKLWKLGQALRAGEELQDSHIWKMHQQAVNALLTILGFIVLFLPEEIKNTITEQNLNAIAEGIFAVGGIVNLIITPATTKKINIIGKTQK